MTEVRVKHWNQAKKYQVMHAQYLRKSSGCETVEILSQKTNSVNS